MFHIILTRNETGLKHQYHTAFHSRWKARQVGRTWDKFCDRKYIMKKNDKGKFYRVYEDTSKVKIWNAEIVEI